MSSLRNPDDRGRFRAGSECRKRLPGLNRYFLSDIIESICSALGRKPPRLSLPVGLTRTLISFIEKGSHAIGLKPPITRAIIDKYTEDVAVDGSLIQKELGFVPQYDLRAGWEETIREMREKNSFSF